MSAIFLIVEVIQTAAWILSVVILAKVVLSFFMAPWHPIRQSLDSFVEPMLAPIRRYMPSTGMLDFSPMILLILIQVIAQVLIQILLGMV